MTETKPIISVLMPVYNTPEEYLRPAIESILNQTFKSLELIIYNDGSTNNVKEVVLSYDDSRIRYFESENQGISKTTNKMIDLAQGEFIALMDSDDISLPERLEIQLNYLMNNPDTDVVSACYKKIPSNNIYHLKEITIIKYFDLLKNNTVPGAVSLFRRKIFNEYNLRFDEKFSCAQDYEFFSRVIRYSKIVVLPDVLYLYRILPDSNSHSDVNFLESMNKVIQQEMLNFLTKEKQMQKKTNDMIFADRSQTNKKYTFWQKIFSVKNSQDKNHKVFTFLGIKLKFKRRFFAKAKKFIDTDIANSNIDINKAKKLVVIPSESLESIEAVGFSQVIEAYYNPNKYFDKVYLLSPLEKEMKIKYGMTIIPCNDSLFKQILKYVKPDCVRAYGGYWATTFAVKNRVEGIPVVASVHDTNPTLLHEEIKDVDKAICVSQAVADLVKKQGLDESKIEVFRDRVSLDVFKKADNPEFVKNYFDGKYKNILHIGRRVEQKNIENTILAFKYLPDEYRFIQIGLGDEKQYEKLISDNDLTDRCFFRDTVNNSDLAYLYSSADAMCVPSLWEGFGIVFIEAAACSCPVITSNIEPMNKYLTNNLNAVLIDDYKNPEEIAKAIRNVCEDKTLNDTLRENARKAAEPFDRHKVNELEILVYKSVINE